MEESWQEDKLSQAYQPGSMFPGYHEATTTTIGRLSGKKEDFLCSSTRHHLFYKARPPNRPGKLPPSTPPLRDRSFVLVHSITRDVKQRPCIQVTVPSLSLARSPLLMRFFDLPVFGLDEVAQVLGLLVSVVVVAVAVVVVIVLGTDVLHLVDAAALGASLDRAVASDL